MNSSVFVFVFSLGEQKRKQKEGNVPLRIITLGHTIHFAWEKSHSAKNQPFTPKNICAILNRNQGPRAAAKPGSNMKHE
jgi:hypothetical protein